MEEQNLVQNECLNFIDFKNLTLKEKGEIIDGSIGCIDNVHVKKGEYAGNCNYNICFSGRVSKKCETGLLEYPYSIEITCRVKFSNDENGSLKGVDSIVVKDDLATLKRLEV